jgi:hypothetical protein
MSIYASAFIAECGPRDFGASHPLFKAARIAGCEHLNAHSNALKEIGIFISSRAKMKT